MKVWNVKVKCSGKFGQVMAGKNTQVFLTWNLKNNCSSIVFYEWSTAEFTRTWRFLGVKASLKLGCCDFPLSTSSLWWPEIAVMSYDRSFSYTVICINSWQLCQFGFFFSSFLFSSVFFLGHETTYIIRVFAVYKLHYYIYWNDSLTECTKPSKLGKSI